MREGKRLEYDVQRNEVNHFSIQQMKIFALEKDGKNTLGEVMNLVKKISAKMGGIPTLFKAVFERFEIRNRRFVEFAGKRFRQN